MDALSSFLVITRNLATNRRIFTVNHVKDALLLYRRKRYCARLPSDDPRVGRPTTPSD